MDQSSYERMTAILTQVLETAPELRERVMLESCGADSALLESVRAMLALASPDEGLFSDASVARRRGEMEELIDGVQSEATEWMPERIGSYEIEEVIGRGGTGVVFKAKQERPSRYVAIKLLHPAYASDKTITRLSREAEFLGSLQHIGIAQIFEAGAFDAGAGEQPFLVMEWIRGRDLLAHAQREKLDTRGRVELFARVVEAVSHAHENGITHRDLKPDNVLVAADTGQPKLLDFGIASMDEMASSVGATMEGDLLGTVAYMAPEQARRSLGGLGPHTDVYSLGAIAFELLAHRPLRQVAGLSITQALSEVAEREAPRLGAQGVGLARDLVIIIEKTLELAPRDRYATATELGADLRRFLEERPITARPPSWWDRSLKFTKRHRVLVAGVLATTMVFVVGLVATLHQARLARVAEDATRRELYAAQMVLATSNVSDPATSSRIAAMVERWREEAAETTSSGRPGWEWLLLDSVRRDQVLELPLAGDPLPIAWDPNGTRIAVGLGNAMAVHDAATGEQLAYVEIPDSVGLETDYTLLTAINWDTRRPERVVASGVGVIAAWDVGSNELAWRTQPVFARSVEALPDGRVLAFDGERSISVLDGDTGETLESWPGIFCETLSLDFHAPSQRLLLSSKYDASAVLDLGTMRSLPGQLGSVHPPTCLRWHPDGERFAASFQDRVAVFQADPWANLLELKIHEEVAFSVDWSADGTLLATAAADRTVRIHDGTSGRLLSSFVGHSQRVRDARFSPTDRRIASVGSSGKVLVWDADELDAIRVREPDAWEVKEVGPDLDWKPETGTVALTDTKRLLEWNVEDDSHSDQHGAYVSSDGQWIFVHGATATHEIRDRAGEVVLSFDNPSYDSFLCGAWHPTESQFVAVLHGGIYHVRMGADDVSEPRKIAPFETQVKRVRWSRDGESVAIATFAGTMRGVSVPSGAPLFEFALESPIQVESFDWSPDGSRLVIGCSDGGLRIRSTRGGDVDGNTERILRGHSSEVDGLSWHPDGSRIASASRDGTVKLWDPKTGHMMGSFECEGRPADVAWVHGGRALVAVDIEGRLYTFDASRGIERFERERR